MLLKLSRFKMEESENSDRKSDDFAAVGLPAAAGVADNPDTIVDCQKMRNAKPLLRH